MPDDHHHQPDDHDESARWKRVETLFHNVRALPAVERRRFLDERCADDGDLRAAVEKLLAADDETEGVLDRPAFDRDTARAAARTFLREGDALAPGVRVGAYRLVRVVGEGGMSSVWLAERADGQFEQTVAIKFIKRGMDTDDILRRFHQERQLLAGLDHPNIARLLGGGSTNDGRPYLVMEYVEGRPIDDYADAQRLTVAERLDVFRTVCEAVQSAHRSLVVHRDLKPSNILVDDHGLVKLLDFGIAKVIDPGAGDLDITATHARLMTPRYASPEQVRGEPVSTACDVYSLGVILYELLTGHRPYELTSQSRHEIDQVICERIPTRPSSSLADPTTAKPATGEDPDVAPGEPRDLAGDIAALRRTDPRRLRRALAGDLDLVVMKALRKEPDRRYASVQQFSEDIDHFLKGMPVSARPDSLGYRATKFVRRNRALVASLVLLLLVSIGAAIVSTWLAIDATRARNDAIAAGRAADREAAEARRQTRIAQSINTYLNNLLTEADPQNNPEGRDVTIREAVSQAAGNIGDTFSGEPELEAAVRYTVGNILKNLGDLEQAYGQLKQAVDLRREILGPDNVGTVDAEAEFALTATQWGHYDEAEATLLAAVDAARNLPETKADAAIAAKVFNNLGLLYLQRQQWEDAEQRLRDALHYQRIATGDAGVNLATNMHNLGGALWMQGRIDEGETFLRDALDMRRSLLGDLHPQVAQSINTLGWLYMRAGRIDDAEPYLRESLEMRLKLYDPPHPNIGVAYNNLADVARARGDYAEAAKLVRQALDQWLPTLGEQHPNVINGYQRLGEILEQGEDFSAAEDAFASRLDILQRAEPIDVDQVASTLVMVGRCLLEQGRFDEAEARFVEARDRLAALDADDAATALAGLAGDVRDLYQKAGRDDDARRWAELTDSPPTPPAGSEGP